jgi:bifunctional UDP-N-acetylglucosamine pyrophosphorylase/glucosamine-1-phosphate N-acetyltransferase
MTRAAVILAAGMGTRMKSATPKVMHKVAGLPILGHVIQAVRGADVTQIVVVTAPDADDVRAYATGQGARSVVQERQLGTGHAAAAAAPALAGFEGEVVICYGDMPLMTKTTLSASFAARGNGLAIVAFRSRSTAYGRVIADADGMLDRIVEFRDANADERKVDLCNAGIVSADAKDFFRWAGMLENNNAQKEYYLTDVPMLARREGRKTAIAIADEAEMLGVNSRAELAAAEAAMQQRLRAAAMDAGVGMTAPETVFLSHDTVLEADAQIGPYVVFGPGVVVRGGAEIRAFSHLEGAEVLRGASVGPYARLRPGTRLEEGVHIGNFVEVKNSRIETGAKANHLAYLGDARVGAGANIGAGTITCNYDGFDKHPTDIGAGAFIGSNTALVAPVTIGDGATTGAGSVITRDVDKDALAIERSKQRQVAGWAAIFRARKKAAKGK